MKAETCCGNIWNNSHTAKCTIAHLPSIPCIIIRISNMPFFLRKNGACLVLGRTNHKTIENQDQRREAGAKHKATTWTLDAPWRHGVHLICICWEYEAPGTASARAGCCQCSQDLPYRSLYTVLCQLQAPTKTSLGTLSCRQYQIGPIQLGLTDLSHDPTIRIRKQKLFPLQTLEMQDWVIRTFVVWQ